jgi:hypothetical protein
MHHILFSIIGGCMKALTIRGVEPEVAEKLKSKASEAGKSINQLTLDLIKTGLGLKKTKKYSNEYDDLDNLFGRWSNNEFDEIQSKTDQARQIDQELWQ